MITFDEVLGLIQTHAGVRTNSVLLATQAAKVAFDSCKDSEWCMVETGTWRGIAGDGYSTWLFGAVAQSFGKVLYSIDNNEEHVRQSIEHIKLHPEASVSHHISDSIAFLSRFSSTIGFAYLDSYDYTDGTPLPSQLHNFGETCAIIGKMAARSVILCDDAYFPSGGKPHLTTKWLVDRGWKLVLKDQQVLFTNWDFFP